MSVVGLYAQDIHFSQFYYSPLNLSPALTGIYKGDVRAMGNFRSQWASVPVSYTTFSGSADLKFYDKRLRNTLFAGGILLNYDEAGSGSLSTAEIGLSLSLTQQLADNHFLTLGAQLRGTQRAVRLADLSFDNQYDGDQYNPGLPTYENLVSGTNFYASMSIGANYHFQIPDLRTRADIGIGYFHVNQPGTGFYGDQSVIMPSRLSFYGMGNIGLGESVDFILRFHSLRQADFRAMLVGAGLRLFINRTRGREFAFVFGSDYRMGDALIPGVRFEYGPVTIGLSYDLNTSDFKTASTGYGGFELSATYIYSTVRPLDVHKICPIF